MSNNGCRIKQSIPRLNVGKLRDLASIGVANIADCMNRIAAVDASIRPYNQSPLAGIAYTVKVPAGDNLMLHKAMDLAQPGDVLVIDAEGGMQRAIFGEIMASYCYKRGIKGLIVDGCIRDQDAIASIPIAVYAKGVTPNGPYKNGPGEIGYQISFGGIVIQPGDILIGDADGIIALNPREVEQMYQEASAVQRKETEIIRMIRESSSYDRPWVDEQLANIGCLIEP